MPMTLQFILIVKIVSSNKLVHDVNRELNEVNVWIIKNKLSLNINQTKCIMFHTRQRQINYVSFSLMIKKPLFKVLGLLKLEDLYYLKIIKYYYNMSCGNLPYYINVYIDIVYSELPYIHMDCVAMHDH